MAPRARRAPPGAAAAPEAAVGIDALPDAVLVQVLGHLPLKQR
jgi:hypothetical protein